MIIPSTKTKKKRQSKNKLKLPNQFCRNKRAKITKPLYFSISYVHNMESSCLCALGTHRRPAVQDAASCWKLKQIAIIVLNASKIDRCRLRAEGAANAVFELCDRPGEV